MRIARYWDAAANAAKYGVVEGETVRELAGHPYREIVTTSNVRPLAATQLLAPCEPTKIIAGGANYHGHLQGSRTCRSRPCRCSSSSRRPR